MIFVEYIQLITFRAEQIVQARYSAMLNRMNISTYFLVRQSVYPKFNVHTSDIDNYDHFLKDLASVIGEASKVQVSLGEMGNRLIDNADILNALSVAYGKNNAVIEIIHGPHVDPTTRYIFGFARDGIVQLFRTPHYNPHHFIIVTDTSGRIHIADENPHNEAMWCRDENQNLRSIYRSFYRIWYITRDSHRYAQKLQQEFLKRKIGAEQSFVHPGSAQNYSSVNYRILMRAVRNFPYRYFFQPLNLILDKNPGNHGFFWRLFINRLVIFILWPPLFMLSLFRQAIYPLFHHNQRLYTQSMKTLETSFHGSIQEMTLTSRPLSSIIEDSKENTSVLLFLDRFVSLLLELEYYDNPYKSRRLAGRIKREDIISDIYDVMNTFSKSPETKKVLIDEMNWVTEQIGLGKYEELDRYLTSVSSRIASLFADGRFLGQRVESILRKFDAIDSNRVLATTTI